MRGRQVFELSDFESEKASGDEEAEGAAASSVDGAFSTSRTLGAIVADEGSRAVPAGPEAKAAGRRRQERAAAPSVDTKFMTAFLLMEGFRCSGAHGGYGEVDRLLRSKAGGDGRIRNPVGIERRAQTEISDGVSFTRAGQ